MTKADARNYLEHVLPQEKDDQKSQAISVLSKSQVYSSVSKAVDMCQETYIPSETARIIELDFPAAIHRTLLGRDVSDGLV